MTIHAAEGLRRLHAFPSPREAALAALGRFVEARLPLKPGALHGQRRVFAVRRGASTVLTLDMSNEHEVYERRFAAFSFGVVGGRVTRPVWRAELSSDAMTDDDFSDLFLWLLAQV